MSKISINDIPQFTDWGSYHVQYEWQYLIGKIEELIEEDNLELNPDFQRGYVWNEEQQIKYIEFCLKGGLSGRDFLFNNPNWMRVQKSTTHNDFVLVDGLQRLTAIQKFVTYNLKVFGDYKLSDFDNPKLLLRRQRINIHINNLKSKKEVLQWYIDLNSGGTVHSVEEIERVKKLILEET